MELSTLVKMSNTYGSNPAYVLAGGGNTSVKDDTTLYVKGSGTQLATIKAEEFVKMDRARLNEIMKTEYPADDVKRESAYLADVMAAVTDEDKTKRPSVEALLHNLFAYTYVLHVHPTLINGLTCGKGAKALCEELLGKDVLWIDICKPGYTLARICFEKMNAYKEETGKDVQVLLLQNHGIFVAADTVEEIGVLFDGVIGKLEKQVKRTADVSDAVTPEKEQAAQKLSSLLGHAVEVVPAAEVDNFVKDKTAAAPLLKPFTPDHIVYCGPYSLFVENIDEAKNDTGVKIKSYSNITDVQNAVAAGTANSLDRARAIVTEYPDDFGHDVTKVENSDIYDWGDLTALNDRATELEEKYNIEIYMGAEVPDSLDYYNLKQNDDVSTLSEALGSLEQIFDCYPRDFFTQLCFGTNEGIRLYITGDISGNNNGTISEASGFVTNINSHIVIVLDANYCWNWDYTVNHEIAHLIDRRLEFLSQYKDDIVFSEKKWNTYNPDDFTYLESYDNYENNPDYGKYSQYFIDPYGTTYATEDRAELFGTVMNNALSGITDDSQFAPDTVLYDKMKYYCDCIRDGFSTEGWADTLPWELMFK